jgi:hypothetical protein
MNALNEHRLASLALRRRTDDGGITERYMDPPGQAMADCLIAARIANNMERVLREQGKQQQADAFIANPKPVGRSAAARSWP